MLCLFLATIALPGERKSAVQSAIILPILAIEKALVDAKMPDIRDKRVQKATSEKAADAAMAKASKTGDANDLKNAQDAAAMAAAIEIPAVPRLVADDVPPEKTIQLLAEQKGRLAIISAEGGIFDIIAGRYNEQRPQPRPVAQRSQRRHDPRRPQGP